MAQFDFYGTWSDSEKYIDVLSRSGSYTFVADMWYAGPIPLQFTRWTDESRAILKDSRRIFLWSDQYSQFPPQFSKPTSKGLMRIDPAYCGPALDLSLPPYFEQDGKMRLVAGNLFYQLQYFDPVTGKSYKPHEALKSAYKDAKSLLCKEMQRWFVASQVVRNGEFISTIETIWIGLHAAAVLTAKQAEIQINGEWRQGEDLSRNRSKVPPRHDEWNYG